MSLLIDTTSCLLCVLMSVCANVFANEIGSEPAIRECKQTRAHARTRTHGGLMSDGNPLGKILLDDALLREPTTQYRALFAIVESHLPQLWCVLHVFVCVQAFSHA